MTIYSIRDSLGQELWWTTSRRKALDIAEQVTDEGDYILPDGHVGHEAIMTGLKQHQLPVAVYKSSVIKHTERHKPARVTRATLSGVWHQ